jgi:hypothetical protein
MSGLIQPGSVKGHLAKPPGSGPWPVTYFSATAIRESTFRKPQMTPESGPWFFQKTLELIDPFES